jgi:hypothetical protein
MDFLADTELIPEIVTCLFFADTFYLIGFSDVFENFQLLLIKLLSYYRLQIKKEK